MKISITSSKGSGKTEAFLEKIVGEEYTKGIDALAQAGVNNLIAATPKDSGVTAESWDYDIQRIKNGFRIMWTNDSLDANGTPIVILLQYGHATKDGGWIEGRDFINPALEPIMDALEQYVWEGVTRA